MRVLIINTSERTGGAAVAAQRLCEALNNNGVKAKMMVRDKETDDITVVGTKNGWRAQAGFLWERWCVYCHLHFSRKHLWEIDIANAGTDITKTREFREADVIHLSWINQGMLSLKTIRKILRSKKPSYGPCTTCGLPRQFVIMHGAANASSRGVPTARCCPAKAQSMIWPQRHGNARHAPSPITLYLLSVAAGGSPIRPNRAHCYEGSK